MSEIQNGHQFQQAEGRRRHAQTENKTFQALFRHFEQ